MNGGFFRLREIHQEKVHVKQVRLFLILIFKYPTNLLATIIRPITVKLCSNNKENGYHLLAQPDRMNVQTTNLSDPK